MTEIEVAHPTTREAFTLRVSWYYEDASPAGPRRCLVVEVDSAEGTDEEGQPTEVDVEDWMRNLADDIVYAQVTYGGGL